MNVEDFLTGVAANFEGSKSRPPSVAMLIKKISTYKAFGLTEAEIASRIRPKPKFSEAERNDAVGRYSKLLSEVGLNQTAFTSVMRELKTDSFEGLLRVGELRQILGSYVGSTKMSSKDDGIMRIQKRFEDRLAA
ncbi:MAG: hypothetical protein AAF768_05145 [Pseudomonadota bacterium]